MSRRASRIIILCEDKLHEVVVRRFLTKGWGVNRRQIRVVPYPATGAGSGEGCVRTEFPKQPQAYRSRAATTSTVLIAVIDADTGSVQEHHRELDAAARAGGISPRTADEKVACVVPKRSVETWLAYLDGLQVEEKEPEERADGKFRYKDKYAFKNRESDAHPLVDRLANSCKSSQPLVGPPDSLVQACREFNRIRDVL